MVYIIKSEDTKIVDKIYNTLLVVASEFEESKQDWRHWRGPREDYEQIYEYDKETQEKLARIYEEGVYISDTLPYIIRNNNPSLWSGVKGLVDKINDEFYSNVNSLKRHSNEAKLVHNATGFRIDALVAMINEYDKQILMLEKVVDMVQHLKNTELYKRESKHYIEKAPLSIHQQILNSINITGEAFEKAPDTYNSMPEESLRNIIITNLRGKEYGTVSAEAYNKIGKTDILIEKNGKIVFIAECKIWSGENRYRKAITQLLNYLTWSDKEVAIIIFSKQKKFSQILENMISYTKKHENYLRFTGKTHDNWLYFDFKHPLDSASPITLAVMLYHIPITKESNCYRKAN